MQQIAFTTPSPSVGGAYGRTELERSGSMSGELKPSDEQLIAGAKAGGPAGQLAYSQLVERHQARLVRLMRQLVGGSAHHEDIAQDAFVRAFIALDRYPKDVPFWPWIRTIGTRLAFNHRRARKTRQRYEAQMENSGSSRQPLGDRQALDRTLQKLSYPYREILILRHVEEMSLTEIAAELGVGTSAAKMRLCRARAEFRRLYERVT